MLAYVLEWLENAGVNEIFLVSPPSAASHLRSFLAKHYDSTAAASTLPATEVVVVPEDARSGDALRAVASRITTDFLLLSCDLYTECNPRLLLDLHRLHQPSVTCLFFDGAKSEQGGAATERGLNKENELTEYVGVDAASSRVMFLANGRDLDPEEGVKIRLSAMRKSTNLLISTHLRSSHLYIFRPWVLDMLTAHKELESVEEDLIPLLVKFQYRSERFLKKWDVGKYIKPPASHLLEPRRLAATDLHFSIDSDNAPCHASDVDFRDFLGGAEALTDALGATGGDPTSAAPTSSTQNQNDVVSGLPRDMFRRPSVAASMALVNLEPSSNVLASPGASALVPTSPNFPLGSAKGTEAGAAYRVVTWVPVPGTVVPHVPYTLRASEPWSYIELNRYLARPALASAVRVPASAEVHPRSTVGQDSLVGEGTRMGERCSVKKSVIGAHCVIGKGVKISGSVVMDYIVIDDNVKLDNCVVGFHAKIGKASILTNCDILPRAVIKDSTQLKGERVEYEE
ncbi:hypothetical protein HDU93_005722 [Gonapodya sp. JEL0774]|nr:hypothetical protein HDU93_005722 [Gonapodya sp. JEL0774]